MKALSSDELKRMAESFEGQDLPSSAASFPLPPSPWPLSPMMRQSMAASSCSLEAAKEALSYISSDVPRGIGTIIGPDGQPVDDYWFGVILAIRREYHDEVETEAKEVARKWSQKSSRYTEDGFEKAWDAYDPQHPKPVRMGSVLALAKAKGWPGHSPPEASPVAAPSRFRLLGRKDIMALPKIQWRVKGLFPKTGIGAIFGPAGSGKSFLAIDAGLRIAVGNEWFGHRTSACAVTYVMLEGEAGLQNRVTAWEQHNSSTVPENFRAVAQSFQIADKQDVEDLAAVLPKEGVIIIDTLNRAAPGLDENSSKDMGDIIAGMKRLQEQTESLVLFVHHTGKDSSKGLRGHSSLHAALDAAVEVERTTTGKRWTAAKVKDGPDGVDHAFKLCVVELGMDADGEKITSCAVGPDSEAIFQRPEPTGAKQKVAIKTIRHALRNSQQRGQAGCDSQTPCILVEEAITAVANTLTAEKSGKRSNRAKSIVEGLISGDYLQSGLDENEDGWLWE